MTAQNVCLIRHHRYRVTLLKKYNKENRRGNTRRSVSTQQLIFYLYYYIGFQPRLAFLKKKLL